MRQRNGPTILQVRLEKLVNTSESLLDARSESVDSFQQASVLCSAIERLLFLDFDEAAVRIAGIGGPTPRVG